MTDRRVFKKGDEVWAFCPKLERANLGPQRAKILLVTDNPGKQVGVQFIEENIGLHNCDGYGSCNNCLWVRAEHILSDNQVADLKRKAESARREIAQMTFNELDELVVPDSSQDFSG
jgi:hypothetical protein